MNARLDRTLIAPMLLPYFPHMAKASSDEWNGFLNEITGLDILPDVPNGNAFDQWRQALKEQKGLPVWGISKEREAQIKADGVRLKNHVGILEAAQPARLAQLAQEAPRVTLAQLLKKMKPKDTASA